MNDFAGDVAVQIRADLAPFQRGLARAKREAQAFDRAASRSMTGMQRAIGGMTTGLRRAESAVFSLRTALVGVGAGLAIRKVIRDFADFERGLIGVGKTTDITGKDLERLGRGVQEIARTVPIATTELLSIAQAAGQLGVKGQQNLLRFTETVGKLGLASDLAGDQAATALARILTVTGTSISDVDKLGSTIVQLGNNFAATESEIANVTNRVAQSTAQFNVTAAEVTGIGTALRAVGVQAEAGGTVIGRAFQAINDAVRQGGDAMREMARITGMTRDELRRLFEEDPTAAFQTVVEGLNRIGNQGGDVTQALSSIGLEGVRVVQVMGTLAQRSDVLADALGQANDEWKANAALNREALAAAQSFTAQMQLVANDVNQAAVAIGRELAPEIVKATGHLREFIQEAAETGQIKAFAEDAAASFAFLAENIDTVKVALGALIGLRVGAAFGPWGAAAGLLVGTLGTLATVVDGTSEAARRHKIALNDLDEALDAIRDGGDDAAEAQDRLADAHGRAAVKALENAEAQLRAARASAQAAMPVPFAGEGEPAMRPKLHPEVEALLNERIAQARRRLEEFRLANQKINRDAKADRLGDDVAPAIAGGAGDQGLAGGGQLDTFRQTIDLIRDRTDALRLESRIVNQSAGAQEAARAKLELMNAAREAGIDLGPKEKAMIEQTTRAYGEAVEVLERMAEEQERLDENREIARGFFHDLRIGFQKGESAADTFARALQRVTDRLAEMATNDVLDLLLGRQGSGGTGILGQLVGGLFGGFGGASAGPTNIVPVGFTHGGQIRGPGTGTSDSIPALLSAGEFVVREQQARKFRDVLEAINNGEIQGFHTGGTAGAGIGMAGSVGSFSAAMADQASSGASMAGSVGAFSNAGGGRGGSSGASMAGSVGSFSGAVASGGGRGGGRGGSGAGLSSPSFSGAMAGRTFGSGPSSFPGSFVGMEGAQIGADTFGVDHGLAVGLSASIRGAPQLGRHFGATTSAVDFGSIIGPSHPFNDSNVSQALFGDPADPNSPAGMLGSATGLVKGIIADINANKRDNEVAFNLGRDRNRTAGFLRGPAGVGKSEQRAGQPDFVSSLASSTANRMAPPLSTTLSPVSPGTTLSPVSPGTVLSPVGPEFSMSPPAHSRFGVFNTTEQARDLLASPSVRADRPTAPDMTSPSQFPDIDATIDTMVDKWAELNEFFAGSNARLAFQLSRVGTGDQLRQERGPGMRDGGMVDFAGFFAEGGKIPAGMFGIAGEGGQPEAIMGPATVLPNSAMPGGAPIMVNYSPQIDARGADSEAVSRLEKRMDRDRKELPEVIIKTVREANSRRVSLRG